MPRKGEGKGRFNGGKGKDATPRRGWELIDEHPQLTIQFSDAEAPKAHVVNIVGWRALGATAPDFARAFARVHASRARTTRNTSSRGFQQGFVRYVSSTGLTIDKPADMPEEILEGFIEWLKEAGSNTQAQYKGWTQMAYWRSAKEVIQALKSGSDGAAWDHIYIPGRPFAGTKIASSETKEVDLDEYASFMEKVAEEALQTMLQVEPHLVPFQNAVKAAQQGKGKKPRSIEEVAALCVTKYGGFVPLREDLKKNDTELFNLIEEYGHTETFRVAHPGASDLFPFLYLLAGYTGFNQQPLTHLQLLGIDDPTIMGKKRTVLSSNKIRAKSVVSRSFVDSDELLSVNSIVAFIKQWTSVVRTYAPKHVSNDLWMYGSREQKSKRMTSVPIRSLAMRDGNSSTGMGTRLTKYCERLGFQFYGMRATRLAFSDLFLRARPGDYEGLRILLGHKKIETTLGHYRSQHAIEAGKEQLAGTLNLHQRFIHSSGKVDSRTQNHNADRTAATPGFTCADPYDSPLPSQTPGRMCEAYGYCPGCPLAGADADRVRAFGRFLQLREAYESARERLGSEVWKKKYGLSYEALIKTWLPSIWSKDVEAAARSLFLGPIPELE